MNGASASPRSNAPTVHVSKTAELIAAELRGRIARGTLRPGDVLPTEPELVRQFGVSRPTMREAFRILENESLIQVRRGSRGGVVVSAPKIAVLARGFGLLLQMSQVTMADLSETGAILESAAARLLARRRKPEDVRELRQRIDELSALLADRDADVLDFTNASLRFHDVIVERSGNESLHLFMQVLREVVTNHMVHAAREADLVAFRRRIKKTITAFTELTELISAGAADEAAAFWQQETDKARHGKLWGWMSVDAVVDVFVDSGSPAQLSAPLSRNAPMSSQE